MDTQEGMELSLDEESAPIKIEKIKIPRAFLELLQNSHVNPAHLLQKIGGKWASLVRLFSW